MNELSRDQGKALTFWYQHISPKAHPYTVYRKAAMYFPGGDMIKTMGYTISVTNTLQLKWLYEQQEKLDQQAQESTHD